MRKLLSWTTLGLAVIAAAPAVAGDFPQRPVTILVGFPPGTSTDNVARIIGEDLSKKWGQAVIVDNKPGVGGSMAVSLLKRAKPDGYTLALSATAPLNINPQFNKQINYDPLKDFAYITQTTWLPYMLVTSGKSPITSLDQLKKAALAHPDDLTYSSIGIGTTSHLLMEILQERTGIKLRHIPYQGSSQSQTDVIAGNVDMTFDTVVSTMPHVKDGKLHAIAVSTAQPTPLAPNVPSLQQLGVPNFDVGAWLGFVAPAGTPDAVVHKLHDDIVATLQKPEVRKRLTDLGSEVVTSASPQAFKRFVADNYKMWGDVLKKGGIHQ
ncbi:transcriptional initiation protein Tat [Bordetella genomosp. 10]|uniref:Transcriptional initiation protein Tat n=1 Tax=Bordetella genomosp. 10 TaxID=1416804 RepID=A0A261S1U1_9BORD|nr:tripartite tricarboxylate transporter substrate binding protein [Bordetella genomosp. 10]OZI31111.1 transcriptional initiation protein Tat [Bordetella genomosp. 10]